MSTIPYLPVVTGNVPAPRSRVFSCDLSESLQEIILKGTGYTLVISRLLPKIELFLKDRHIATLNPASGTDGVEAFDEDTTLEAPRVSREVDGMLVVTWQGSSARWSKKRYELHAWAGGFSYGYTLEGTGAIDRTHYFRTRSVAAPAYSVRLFNPEPNSGSVHYSGERCELGKHCVMCFPEQGAPRGPEDFMTISVGRDKEFHDGNWMFTPAPFCYVVEGAGNWMSFGIAAEPGEWNFSEMHYPGNGFGFSLAYQGHLEVNGRWESPRLICQVAQDEYAAVQRYCDILRSMQLVPQRGRGPVQDWWREPIFCGWGQQVSDEVHFKAGKAPLLATQANYERWLAKLETNDINPGTVVLDDKWQGSYGLNDIDTERWPDLPGFIEKQHRKGRHVLLWLKAWDPEGVPPEECITDESGKAVAVDPANPAFRTRFTEQVRQMLQEYGADGFKIDFTHLIPRGPLSRYAGQMRERDARDTPPTEWQEPRPSLSGSQGGLWGLELMRLWLEIISEAAEAAKPGSLVITHTANPYLADLVDMLRLNDVAGHEDITASIVPDMRHRARIARAASPYWLLDSDNWPCSSRVQWREYIEAQATGEFGVPSLYFADRLAWGKFDDELREDDYAAIRSSWQGYKNEGSGQWPVAIGQLSHLSLKEGSGVFHEPALSLKQKIGQLIMVEIPGSKVTPEVAQFIREYHPAGVALFARNLTGPWETARLINDLQAIAAEAGDAPLLIGMDQEGGQVSHLRYPCSEMPGQMARVAAGGASAAGEAAEALGREMRRLGINMAFAPVLDVNTNPTNPVIGARAFSDDPHTVTECGLAAIKGLKRAEVISMAKHFPGHGDTATDSHLTLPQILHDRKRLEEVELAPFRAAIEAGVDTICTAHVVFQALDDSGLPGTLSHKIMTELLREELGFKGVLFSDAMIMDAISKQKAANIPPAAIAAVSAGVDCVMLLGSLATQKMSYDALLAAVEQGIISQHRLNEAVNRVQGLRLRVAPPEPGTPWPDMVHQEVAQRLARQAVTLLRDEAGLLPVSGEGWGVVEFASGSISPVESSRNEPLGHSTLALMLGRNLPGVQFLALHSRAPEGSTILEGFLAHCSKIIVATRSAILDPGQAALLRQVAATGKPVVQLVLRSPYDATLVPEIGTVLLSYGDPPTVVAAVADVLLGNAPAPGKLPVRLPLAQTV